MPLGRPVTGALCAGGAAAIIGSSVAVLGVLTSYPALAGQAERYLVAAVLLAPVAMHRDRRLLRVSRREAMQLVALAATGLAAFNLFVLAALDEAEPAVVGVVVGSVPLVLAVVGPVAERRAPAPRVVAAALVVTAGAAVVQGFGEASLAGLALSVGALGSEALFSLLAVSLLARLGSVVLSAYICAIAGLGLGVVALAVDGHGAFPVPSGDELLAIAYLAVAVTAAAFVAWYSGVERLGVERAGLFAALIPVSTLLCAAALGTGSLRLGEALGVGLVGVGLGLGLTRPNEGSHAALETTP